MSVYRLQCPACRSVLQVSPEMADAVASCGHCGQRLRVRRAIPPPAKPRRRTALVAAVVTGLFAVVGLIGAYYLRSDPPTNPPAVETVVEEKKDPVTPPPPVEPHRPAAPPPPTVAAPLLAEGAPVLYPAPDQTDVPLAFPGNEGPDPLPAADEKLAGYPITATFPPSARVTDARGRLEEDGREVPAWFSSPARPANPRHRAGQGNTVCLIARAILRPATRYVVRLEASVDGQGWKREWSFTTQPPGEWQRRVRDHLRPRLNLHRRLVGLGPVAVDDKQSRACADHAAYLTRNVGRVEGLKLNEQRPDLPGFTEEGRRVAPASMRFHGLGVEPGGVIEQMLGTVRFRPMVLNPHLDRVGMGADLHPPAGWFWVLYLPPVPSRGRAPVIAYPGPSQTDVPLSLGEPLANLVKGQPADARAGFPVTASFGLSQKVRDVRAVLREKGGALVPCWVSTPEEPLPGVGPFRQVALIPKEPLAPARAYEASFTASVDGEAWSRVWSFTTVDPKREEARIAAGLLKRLNAVRKQAGQGAVTLEDGLSRACGLHAAYIVRNLGHPKVEGMGIHDEEPSLPGYTPEGARAGAASVIAVAPDPAEAVDSWMATLYHRLPLLDPRLKRAGYGQAPHPTRGWVTVLDVSPTASAPGDGR